MSEATATAGAPRASATPWPHQKSATGSAAVRLGPMLMLLGIVAVAIGSGAFWLTGGRYVTIDDSYVRAAKETLSTDVSGIVMEVPVKEGQHVRKGEVLLRLDPRQFQIALRGCHRRHEQHGLELERREARLRPDGTRRRRQAAAGGGGSGELRPHGQSGEDAVA